MAQRPAEQETRDRAWHLYRQFHELPDDPRLRQACEDTVEFAWLHLRVVYRLIWQAFKDGLKRGKEKP